MSTIETKTNEKTWKLYQFLGLNENPDGDTKLKMGEASTCKNWKVTRDRNLKKRPGFRRIMTLQNSIGLIPYARGLWFGDIMGEEIALVAYDENLYEFYRNGYLETPINLGALSGMNGDEVDFIAFNNIVYILDGSGYYSYDGQTFAEVEGYRPLVGASRAPNGADATTLEGVNKLNGMRRVWFSPDGLASTFLLPENNLLSVDYVIETATGEPYPDAYAADTANGTVTFTSVPARGINTIEIGYTVAQNYRSDVTSMRHAELYLGMQDNAVFLYGNGTNKAIYSGVDYNGISRADYFPDLNEMAVADTNTPITAMIRHNSELICYKTTSTYRITFGLITTAIGNSEWGFYVTPVNKSIGNAAPGQVRLVLNAPYALFGNDLYKWENSSIYSAEMTRDERMAVRVSDRIYSTLGGFDIPNCYCYDDNDNQEFYIWDKKKGLVYNYAANAWYTYTSPFEVHSMVSIHGDVICGADGLLFKLDETAFCDIYNDEIRYPIDCYWESGSIDFGKPYMRKFMNALWIGVKPQSHSSVTVTVVTDKKSEYTERVVNNDLMTFTSMNFADFSFKTNRKPQMKKLKIKAKKFAFLKLILKTDSQSDAVTVLMLDPKVRETGYVK